MRRTLNRLTAREITRATEKGRYADGGGLYLNVARGGTPSWIFLFRRAGGRREMGLGPYPTITLARAREKAAEARRELAEGRDPLAVRRQARNNVAPTFKQLADDYIATMAPSWTNPKHAAQWVMTIERYAKPIHQKPVDAIETNDVLEILKPIWLSKAETAQRLRGRIESILDAAKAKGLRQGENPARWKSHLKQLLPPRSKLTRGHMAAMAIDAVPAFVASLRDAPSITASALELLILSASRSKPVRFATFGQIDEATRVWTIPKQHMKSKKEFRIPLCDRAVAIIREMKGARTPGGGELIFPSPKPGRPLSDMAFTTYLKKRQLAVTAHGFRSSFKDWAHQRTGFAREIAEEALAHLVGDETERAYRRGDALERRRVMMAAWADFVGGAPQSNVIRFADRA